MKKLISIMLTLLIATIAFAVEFDYSGELRTRAAMYNDQSDVDGSHIDSRFQLRLDSELHSDLKLGILFEIGDVTWGDGSGSIGGGSVNVKTNELYLDYMIKSWSANIRFGRQYWADHASLILDDNFNGLMLSMEDYMGYKTDLGFIKMAENITTAGDDHNAFFVNLENESFGFLSLYAKNQITREANFTLMPFFAIPAGPASIDLTVFGDYQTVRGQEDEIGYGASIKAEMPIDELKLGADVLYSSEEGLTTISPYYVNGLYIYGYGPCHDGVSLFWGDPYAVGMGMSYLSMVGNGKYPLSPDKDLFGAVGVIMSDGEYVGYEVNGGLQLKLIEDMFKLSGFAAYATPDGGDGKYLLGVNGTVNF